MQKNDYLNLTGIWRQVVEAWLEHKIMKDESVDIGTQMSYEEKIEKYLCDECKDRYVIRTRWSITASKIKCFMKNPEEFWIRYELELPEFEPKDKQAFKMWSAFDVMISSGIDKFSELYYIDKWYVKWDLIKHISSMIDKYKDEIMKHEKLAKEAIEEKILELKSESHILKWREKQKNITPEDVLECLTLDQLRDIFYEAWDRIRLTPAEARDIMAMYHEYVRQPLFDREWEYQWQHYIEAKYGILRITWTLDRFSLEKKLIRDTKTSGRIDRFEYDVEHTFDYITQMAFYFTLAYIQYDELECDVLLDIVSTSSPYASIVYKVSKKKLKLKMMQEIKPAFASLIRCYETNEWPVWDRMASITSPYYPIMQTSIMYQPVE